jgi:cellobiose-specific phosphotransferase system component IIC
MSRSSRPRAIVGARRGGENVARRPEFEWMARAGLVARGVSYGIIGILALKLAAGSGGKATNQTGALKTIAHQQFGKALLIAMAVGLAGYAIWRLVRAGIGHGSREQDSAFDRVAGVASGLAYATICVTAVKILAGASTSGGSNSPKKTTGGVLGWTGGAEIVGIAGAILIGVALYQGYKGLFRKFLETSKTEEMSRQVKRAFTAIGVFGHLARMVVFGLVGYGLVKAAVDYDPHKAIGLDGALNKLSHNSYGPFLLGVVAAGLIGFALYSIADARYRKI